MQIFFIKLLYTETDALHSAYYFSLFNRVVLMDSILHRFIEAESFYTDPAEYEVSA